MMKIHKRILSLILAIVMICAMVISATAATYSRDWTWNGYAYFTTDTCNSRSFGCVMECDSAFLNPMSTNVETYTSSASTAPQEILYGTPDMMVAVHNRSVGYAMHHIVCLHLIDGDKVSSVSVPAG